jgi:iron complex outermembrane receptor protein
MDAQYVDSEFTSTLGRKANAASVQKVGAFFLLNAKLAYDFQIPYRNMQGEVFVAGENLTDEFYEVRAGYPMPGINGMAGVKLRF